MTSTVIVRKICGSCDEKDNSKNYLQDGRFFCPAKQEYVHPDDEGCEVSQPVICPKCGAVVFGED